MKLHFVDFRSRGIRLSLITLFSVLLVSSAYASSIEGIVYDHTGNTLPEIDVELKDVNNRLRGRTQTDGIGRYQFTGLGDGRYTVKVFAFRYNLRDDEKPVRIQTISILGGPGNDTQLQDFHLRPRKGGLGDTVTGVVFVQPDVPKAAKQYYKEALKTFGKGKKDEGFRLLIKAVEVYPKYYDALSSLGLNLMLRKRYREAASMYIRAAEVNPKSSKALFFMGVAFSNLGKDFNNAAFVSFTKAEALAPRSFKIPLAAGKLHRKLGNLAEAEIKLVKAVKLALGNNPDVHWHLALLYGKDLKKFDLAADQLELYLKVSKKKDKKVKAMIEKFRDKAKKNA